MNPIISVIIPTYNSAPYIVNCIESVINQTLNNIEIIIIDDGSTDNTKNKIENYINTEKVHYIKQKNMGVSAARNHGVKIARGEYIAFIDSDDCWLDNKLELQLKIFNKYPEVVLVTTANIEVDVDGNILSKSKLDRHHADNSMNYLDNLLYVGDYVGLLTSSWLLRRNIFLKLNGFVENIISEDYEFLIRLSGFGNFYIISKELVKYMVRSNSLIRSDRKDEYYSLINVINMHKSKYSSTQYRYRIARIFLEWAESCVYYGDKSALTAILKTLENNPLEIKAYLLFVKYLLKKFVLDNKQKLKYQTNK